MQLFVKKEPSRIFVERETFVSNRIKESVELQPLIKQDINFDKFVIP